MNFEVVHGILQPLTKEGQRIMAHPTVLLEQVDQLLTYDEVPYDSQCQRYDLSSYGLTALEEEYLCFLHGL